MKNLENYEVFSLDDREINGTDGGSIIGSLFVGLCIVAGAEIIGDWDNFKKGFAEGWNAAPAE